MCNLCTVLRHCVFYTQRCRLFRRVLFCTIGSYISSSLRGLLNVFRTSATCYVERGDSSEKGKTRLTDLCIVFNSHRKKDEISVNILSGSSNVEYKFFLCKPCIEGRRFFTVSIFRSNLIDF